MAYSLNISQHPLHTSPQGHSAATQLFHNPYTVPLVFCREMSGGYRSNATHISVVFPGSFSLMQCNTPLVEYDGYLCNMLKLSTHTLPPAHEFAPQSHYITSNNNSPASDEGGGHHQQHNAADEKKQRRMISNKESARRSRMRKQQLFNELWSQVVRLRRENHNLVERLNSMSMSSDKLMEEISKLKEESSNLHQMLTSLQIGSPPYTSFQFSDEMHCNSDHLGV